MPRPIGGRWFYVVSFGGIRETLAESDLEAADAGNDLESLLRRNQWGQKQTLSRIVTFTKLRQPLRDVLYAFRATSSRSTTTTHRAASPAAVLRGAGPTDVVGGAAAVTVGGRVNPLLTHKGLTLID